MTPLEIHNRELLKENKDLKEKMEQNQKIVDQIHKTMKIKREITKEDPEYSRKISLDLQTFQSGLMGLVKIATGKDIGELKK